MTISEQDKKSVEEERKKSLTTKRATVEGLENSLFKIFPVLDHGLVRVIDYMGEDDAIVQAARHGIRIDDSEIFVTASPCYDCFKMIANSGINKIYFGEFYRDERILTHASALGIELIDLSN